jgi:pimeloyl-ACP methyl ester carboxylesterase
MTECTGEAAPTLVFVHGLGSDRHDWSPQVAALASRFRCVTFDLPGHGESGIPLNGDIQVLAHALREVIARQACDRVVLVGHRLGCRVVLEAMSLCPDDVVGLVLMEQNLLGGDDPNDVADALDAQVRTLDFPALIDQFLGPLFAAGKDPNQRRSALLRLRHLDPAFMTEALVSAIRWEAQAPTQLAGLKVPILLLQSTHVNEDLDRGSLQPGMKTSWTELVTRLAPETQLHVIPGLDRSSRIEAPMVSEHIGAFGERLRAGATRARFQ